MNALVIPIDGPIHTIELDGTLEQLQGVVGGYIQALPVPGRIDPTRRSVAYVNEDGKYTDLEYNERATEFMQGAGLMPGDYIAGAMLVCGFAPNGEHDELPQSVIDYLGVTA